jgi:hypothetical protein
MKNIDKINYIIEKELLNYQYDTVNKLENILMIAKSVYKVNLVNYLTSASKNHNLIFPNCLTELKVNIERLNVAIAQMKSLTPTDNSVSSQASSIK